METNNATDVSLNRKSERIRRLDVGFFRKRRPINEMALVEIATTRGVGITRETDRFRNG